MSLKLISKIKEEKTRNYVECNLEQAIRYADNDPIEAWLNKLLVLDCVKEENMFLMEYPNIDDCELYHVNKDLLFSYKKTSEAFLSAVMSLFVSSHYKNSPNDLQMISDSSSHQIFILTKNLKKNSMIEGLPEIYCAVQVAIEGDLDKDFVEKTNENSSLPPGDLIPWTLSTYFLDTDFPKLKGVRIVRIATHPSAQKLGYGKKTLELLYNYYQGQMYDITKLNKEINNEKISEQDNSKPLLTNVAELNPPVNFSYLGTSFGLTYGLYKFWKSSGFYPTYIKTLKNTTTGEFSCIMLKLIKNENVILNENTTSLVSNSKFNWLFNFNIDFTRRLINLFSYELHEIRLDLAFELLSSSLTIDNDNKIGYNYDQLKLFFSQEDFKRLVKYSKGLLTLNLIIDLVPSLSYLYFNGKIEKNLSYEQTMILIGVGLQKKSFESIQNELDIIKKERTAKNVKNNTNFGIDQTAIMGMFKKIIVKFTDFLKTKYEGMLSNIKSSSTDFNPYDINANNTDLVLNDIDNEIKENPKKELFENKENDKKIKEMSKKIKTEYYSEKISDKKNNKN